jgi:SulP family sulfate permease
MVTSLVDNLTGRWRVGFERQLGDLRDIPRPSLGDVVGGVSVALVLIPQSLAYAGLAGLPPVLGLFASAFPLLIFAVFASSPYLQTGPVALTSLLTAGALASAGLEPETEAYIGAAAILAIVVGLTRLVIGMLRLGSIVYLMAEPVTIGFTSGAGLVIMSSQLPRALGVEVPDNVADWSNPIARAGWSLTHPSAWTAGALIISAVTLLLMLRGRRIHRLFPGVLVAVVLALLFSRLSDYDGPVIPTIDGGLPNWTLDLPWTSTGSLIAGGLVIALVGFAEPASIARTFANEDQTRWSSSREFVASGLANTVAGLTGAYPVGGSFSRSSVNRFAGAETRVSGAITGLVVLAFLPFASLLDGLPDAVLGAIVIGAVLGLVKPVRLIRLWTRSPWQAALAWVTLIATLLTPPNVQYAVLLGVAMTGLLHVLRPFRVEAEASDDGRLDLRPRGLLWIATNSKLKTRLAELVDADGGRGLVTVNLDRSTAIDAAIADAIAGGKSAADRAGREFQVINAPEGATPILENFDIAVA